MKTIHITGKGLDPISNKRENMKFEVEANSKEDLVSKVLKGFNEMNGLLHMVNIPLHNFNEEDELWDTK